MPHITKTFNNILTTSTLPSSWEHAKIIPIPKTSITFKFQILGPSVYYQHYLMHLKTSGFIPNSTALLNICYVMCNIEDKNSSPLLVLDFEKAFDTVNHINTL